MKYGKSAGLVLAVGVCAGIAIWGVGSDRNSNHETGERPASPASHDATVRLAAPPIAGKPQAFAIDAATVRAAVRDGELHVAMPDGTTQALRIERQYTDETGHWNVVGRAQTRIGPQAMVLTFGANAVFGTLPLSDGRLLSITTGPGGRVAIQPAGGLVPEGKPGLAESPDMIVPPRRRQVPPQTRVLTHEDIVVAAPPTRSNAPTPTLHAAASIATQTASLAAETTPVRIDVLAYYAPDLVTLRGSAAAAETEIANLFASANQSHLDSGTRVRLNVAKMLPLAVSTTDYNQTLLNQMQSGQVPGVDIEAARDTWGADLVTLVRPYHDTDGSCGIAYLGGAGLQGTTTSAGYGYSVVNVAPCSPVTLAHELGHNLGSNHDRETATSYEGDLSQGAFMDSFGYRTDAFATIMAYPLGRPQVAYFSNPALTKCGSACGVNNYADNVRSINLMAPAIAGFRGAPGTVSISDAIVLEPTLQGVIAMVPVRLSAPAPAGGLTVQVSVTGGTATPDVDYTLPPAPMLVTLAPGARETWFTFNVSPDTEIEGDETVALHIDATGAPVGNANATVTIANDDPRPRITGKLAFEKSVPVPTTPIDLTVTGLYDGGETVSYRLLPPEFRYDFPVRFGGALTIDGLTTDDFVTRRKRYNEVVADKAFDLPAERGIVLSGRLTAPPGMAISDTPVTVSVIDGVVNHKVTHLLTLSPPDFDYRWRIPRNEDVIFRTDGFLGPGNAREFAPYAMNLWRLGADTTFDLGLSTQPTIALCCGTWRMQAPASGYHGYMAVSMYLSAPAPVGGVTVHYVMVDGTAKRGVDWKPSEGFDYSGTITIPEGQTFAYLSYPDILGDDVPERSKYFDVVVDQAVGARMPISSVRFWILEQSPRTGGVGQMMRTN